MIFEAQIKGVQWSLKSLCVNEQPMGATELILKSIEERMVVNISQLTDISDSCSFQLNRFAEQANGLQPWNCGTSSDPSAVD